MNMPPHITAAAAAACALCGCLTVATDIEKRIGQRPGAYAGLTADQQARARLGHIQIGDPADMLWMVFGDPAGAAPAAALGDAGGSEPAGARALETWTYIREADPRASGSQPPVPVYQPGAMFAANPPPPPARVVKTYVLSGGVIVDMDTQNETPGN